MEHHKDQPSPTFSFKKQLEQTREIKLFKESSPVRRDFIFINDVVKIIQFFLQEVISTSEVFNIGSGVAISFEEIADAMIERFGYGKKVYIDRPKNLTSNYQEYTLANITKLRMFGYNEKIPSVLDYIKNYPATHL
jgi:ADP-L-glycero-D-manno-heptose 6-epimerase